MDIHNTDTTTTITMLRYLKKKIDIMEIINIYTELVYFNTGAEIKQKLSYFTSHWQVTFY